MMDQFKVRYIPGGMGLSHSAWWLCEWKLHWGEYGFIPVRMLRRSEYQ